MIRVIVLAGLLVTLIPTLNGQLLPNNLEDPPMPGMHHRQDVIDGAKTPDLIPDSTAYRLFLITVSEVSNPTSEQLSRQIAFLKTAGLDEDDINSAIPILAKFKSEYGISSRHTTKRSTTPMRKVLRRTSDLFCAVVSNSYGEREMHLRPFSAQMG